jgi:hypothetical protein
MMKMAYLVTLLSCLIMVNAVYGLKDPQCSEGQFLAFEIRDSGDCAEYIESRNDCLEALKANRRAGIFEGKIFKGAETPTSNYPRGCYNYNKGNQVWFNNEIL